MDRWMVFLRLEVELSERERETAQLKGWSRGQIDDARELSGATWWCLAIGCGFPRHALTEDGRRAAKASLDTQHAKTGELADCPGRKPDCPGRARIFGVVTLWRWMLIFYQAGNNRRLRKVHQPLALYAVIALIGCYLLLG